jgi:hypothetical protein
MADQDPIRDALRQGWHRSLQASSENAPRPWYAQVWYRYRWWIVSGLLFLLGELVLFTMGGTIGGHF